MKILIKIKGNSLQIINKKKLNTEYKNMLNTNVISHDELVFSDEYIKTNPKLMTSFLNELAINSHVNTISFQNNEVAYLLFPLMSKLKNITSIIFESDETLPYNFYEYIEGNNAIKFVSANYIPNYIFELLDKKGIIPESRDEILFTSNFMELNNLKSYASLYYKYIINLEFPLNKDDINDFSTFCKINRKLKMINIDVPNKINLEEIIFILKESNHRGVTIVINGDIHDSDLIDYLRKYNKVLNKKYKIKFKLKYSDYYIQENIVKETNNRILRMSAILIFNIIIITGAVTVYDNYSSMLKIAQIQEEINEYIINTDPTEIIEDIEAHDDTKTVKNTYLASLKTLNDDVSAWIKVKNTNIDYAVVQYEDNDYYLKHNLYGQKEKTGWLFMDFRNDSTELQDNTIIYGHNSYSNGVMFGTLTNVSNKKWYQDEENQIIELDTLYESYKFKIFSFYIIDTTSDYLTVNLNDNTKKLNFFNMLKNRSFYNFDVELNENDKILTLSTCHSSTTRFVVHAVLVNE